MKKTGLFILLISFLAGCYYDVEEELYPDTGCMTDGVTYSGVVLPILEKDCYVCHSAALNTAGITLEGYDNLIRYVENGKLLGVIKHEPGFPEMPQNAPQLLDCEIEKIERWINDGALNN